MKITSLRTAIVETSFKKSFRTKYGEDKKGLHVLVEIKASNGLKGFGEASPLTFFTGETINSIIESIEKNFKHILVGKDPTNIEKIISEIDKIPGKTTAKNAIDTAIHDLVAKELNIPIYKLLGGKYREKIAIAEAIGMDDPEKMASQAPKLSRKGFKTIKIKVGSNNLELDIERVKAVREALGYKIKLRIDANGAYSVEKALKFIKKIERYQPEYFEQPVSPRNLDGMRKIKKATSIPILADESAYNLKDVLKIVKLKAADIIGVKLIKCGGIHNAKKMIHVAEAADIPCVLISPFEIGVGLAANLHVAYSSKNVSLPCELAIGTFYEDNITTGICTDNKYMWITGKKGLGIKFKKNIFNKL